ncbi:hypothetical protein CEXT_724931 [Caerostris extrusa]|uniref:Uncharacterized protein n=1 Tax=Caerostris extrusa TaxID=172846 RepID=A0AAV4XMW4_CAEEX|nr:hypothetical protein CEXT_724931 [Caerostris extrusa]
MLCDIVVDKDVYVICKASHSAIQAPLEEEKNERKKTIDIKDLSKLLPLTSLFFFTLQNISQRLQKPRPKTRGPPQKKKKKRHIVAALFTVLLAGDHLLMDKGEFDEINFAYNQNVPRGPPWGSALKPALMRANYSSREQKCALGFCCDSLRLRGRLCLSGALGGD